MENREALGLILKIRILFFPVLPCTSHGCGTPHSMVCSTDAQACSSLSWSVCLHSLFSYASQANNPSALVRVTLAEHYADPLYNFHFLHWFGLHTPPCSVQTCCVIPDKQCEPGVCAVSWVPVS